MGKLTNLNTTQVSKLVTLEANLEKYIVGIGNIPRITAERAAKMIEVKTEIVKLQAHGITGFDMKADIRVRTPQYVIVSLYPADEPAPAHATILPEYEYGVKVG